MPHTWNPILREWLTPEQVAELENDTRNYCEICGEVIEEQDWDGDDTHFECEVTRAEQWADRDR